MWVLSEVPTSANCRCGAPPSLSDFLASSRLPLPRLLRLARALARIARVHIQRVGARVNALGFACLRVDDIQQVSQIGGVFFRNARRP